ncbi:MAG: alpha/beta hydrolase [Caldilineaceae bacterium]|nr:alpha/beta hydrolase [Caldilineaceae bacterium]
MKQRWLRVALLCSLFSIALTVRALPAVAQEAAEPLPYTSLHVTPFLARGGDVPLEAEWIRMLAPENRTDPESSLVEIPAIRFKTDAAVPAPPIFILTGGPGAEPTPLEDLDNYLPLITAFIPKADVILMEQRAVGNARPVFDCPGGYDLRFDLAASRLAMVSAQRDDVESCADFWTGQNVDLVGYDTIELATDVEALRQALGYDKISLFGIDYGTHQGVAVLRYYGANVDRAILALVRGPDQTLRLPNDVERQLEALDLLVQTDPNLSSQIPSFLSLVDSVLAQLEANPITASVFDPEQGASIPITVGKLDLQLATSNALATGEQFALPARYFEMKQGNYSWLANHAYAMRRGLGANLMPTLVECASGASENRQALVDLQATEARMGNALNGVALQSCDLVGNPDLGDDFRSQLFSDTPVLLVSGSMDAETPVTNASEVLDGLENGQHLVVLAAPTISSTKRLPN